LPKRWAGHGFWKAGWFGTCEAVSIWLFIASFVSNPSWEAQDAKAPSCIATTSDRITLDICGETATERGLNAFEDHALRLLALRTLERPQIISRLVALDSREQHRRGATANVRAQVDRKRIKPKQTVRQDFDNV